MDNIVLVEILIAFGLKMCDNALGTVKTIYLSKGKYVLAAVFNSLSTLFYLLAVVRIANSNDIYSLIAMCVATFIGTLMPCFIIKKSERDKLYIFDITSDTMENGKRFADHLRDMNVALNTATVYDRNMQKTLLIKVYCSSKDESRIINEMLKKKESFKYNIYVPIED